MKISALFLISLISSGFSHIAFANHSSDQNIIGKPSGSSIKAEEIIFYSGDVMMHGYVAYDSSVTGKRPVVLVVPEWWGVTDYTKMRARQLAELGYLAITVDIYGDGKVADNPGDAQKYATP